MNYLRLLTLLFIGLNYLNAQNLKIDNTLSKVEKFAKRHKVESIKKESLIFLTDALSLSKDVYLENNDSDNPRFTNWIGLNRKIAGDNPSTNYYSAFISSKNDYVIKGNLGKAFYVGVQVYKQDEGYNLLSESIASEAMEISPNGDYEINLSAANTGGKKNWLKISDDDYIIILREYYSDYNKRLNDIKTTPIIDKLASNSSKEIENEEEKIDTNTSFVNFFEGLVENSIDLTNSLSVAPNTSKQEVKLNPKNSNALFPSKDIFYEGIYVKLNDDEALEVTVKNQPISDYFSWTFYSPLYTTPDYSTYKVQLVKEDIKLDRNNNYKFYVSKEKLNLLNAIQTGQYNTGVLSFRYLKNKKDYKMDSLDYEIKLIKLKDIK
ncbi:MULTISPECIES: hypothetical protein [Flavobacterium]|uniref:DUF1214 domain-containing protein n=1 Tax=Flavobacterium covae TaxID=2906076 RepID=A0ABW8PEV4_9FLAO|nr:MULTISPECIES: hypothetical protein [Flavobacterium]OXA83281.1 hypothetical protein B0A56_01925 [Flavobacterium columnare NBRC 100251 = ATCC 23463]AMA49601.1 hypothetical protein AWN65_09070 [Flavobacterium covae]MCJ1806037.1 hypothetical protein [Flavobacterium covae]MCJ1808117.1 hypothetical protein [Flavobacterium covae]OWP82545.1 hypothetical protein BWK63_00570 [Flavobacterium covae]